MFIYVLYQLVMKCGLGNSVNSYMPVSLQEQPETDNEAGSVLFPLASFLF